MRDLLRTCGPLRVEGGYTLVIGLEDTNLRQQLEDRVSFLREAAVQLFDERVSVRLELMSDNTSDADVSTQYIIQNDPFYLQSKQELGADIGFIEK